MHLGELRKLTWDHVDLDITVIRVWRSASRTSDIKTPKPRRSLVLPKRAVAALQAHKKRQSSRIRTPRRWRRLVRQRLRLLPRRRPHVHQRRRHVTETVYRHVIVPVIRGGATVMDAVFGEAEYPGNGDGQPTWPPRHGHHRVVTWLLTGSRKQGPKASLSWRPVTELSHRPSPYHLGATRSIEVVGAGHRTLTVMWGRCRAVRLLHFTAALSPSVADP
jgi:hypothetical protein